MVPTEPEAGPVQPGGTQLRRSVAIASDRIGEILETAERIAGEVRAEAEAEARGIVEHGHREAERIAADAKRAAAAQAEQLGQLAENVLRSAARYRAEADELVAELEHAAAELRGGGGREPPPAAAPEDETEAALLRATQMAVAGSDRAVIARTLESEFSVPSPERILEEVLGPE